MSYMSSVSFAGSLKKSSSCGSLPRARSALDRLRSWQLHLVEVVMLVAWSPESVTTDIGQGMAEMCVG